jgi:arginine/lysine/ornithine decarboxylase
VIAPGEEITPEIIDYLRLELKAGVRIQGPFDGELAGHPRREGVTPEGG